MHEEKQQDLSWVKLVKYCELSGDTRNAVYKRIADNVWKRGKQYTKRAGVYWINLPGVEKWVARKQ